MRLPKSLETLADHGVIEEVLRPLMSGKEAQIYLVVAEGQVCAAKIYKDAQNRSFKNRADYVEGRKVRNSRDQRAMSKGSKYGKSKDEDTWKSTEVEMIYRLQAAGVRVPKPHVFIDGVLVMELVQDPDGNPAPRLGDLHFTPEEATEIFHLLLTQVTRMLCAGIVHGDLSDFNVLLAWDGPVVIDFPQSINAAGNLNARRLLLRDVENLHRFLARFVPGIRRRPYGEEMWSLYENNQLFPETKLNGRYLGASAPVDTSAVLSLIDDANQDEERRRVNAGRNPSPTSHPGRRREVVIEKRPVADKRAGTSSGRSAAGDRNPRATSSGGHAPTSRNEAYRPRSDARGADRPPRDGSRPRPGGPPRGPGRPTNKPSGPKRGDSIQNSSYVSPEARKAKVSSLTLRVDDKSNQSPDRQTRTSREGRRPRDETGPRQPRRSARSSERHPSAEGRGTDSTRSERAPATANREGASPAPRDPNARRRNRRPRTPGQDSHDTQSATTAESRRPRAQSSSSSTAASLVSTTTPNTTTESESGAPRRRRRRRRPGGASPAE